MLAACDPVPQSLTLTGGMTGTATASRFLQPTGSLSLSNQVDGVIRNVSYTGDLEKRVYLFSWPMWPTPLNTCSLALCSWSAVHTLALPLPAASLGTSSTDIAPDSTKWPGVRAYDIGLCSQNTAWADLGAQMADGIITQLTDCCSRNVRGLILTGVPEARPILLGNESIALDRIGFKMSFFAETIAGQAGEITAGCRDVSVNLRFEFALGTKPGTYVRPVRDLQALAESLARLAAATSAEERSLQMMTDRTLALLTDADRDILADFLPSCTVYPFPTFPLPPCDFLPPVSPPPTAEELDALLGRHWCPRMEADAPIPFANDPTVTISNLSVGVQTDHCFGGASTAAIQEALQDSFSVQLPSGLADAIRDSLLRDGREFGREGMTGEIAGRICSCDIECTESASVTNPFGAGTGGRHRCLDSRCAFQLEPDRFEVRPEGLEAVLAEDDGDPQAAVFVDILRGVHTEPLCDGRRGRVVNWDVAVPGVLVGGDTRPVRDDIPRPPIGIGP